mgnify:CR=1 FL=1
MNNRQGGRRRGRGGPRPQGMSGNAGNARDNRQRGNAAQLLEKYKNMARDAQLAGDRVQTEYYLQFADHYFRVLSETRSRFEDQRRSRDDEGDDEDLDEELEADGEEERSERFERTERPDRSDRRRDRGDRYERGPRADRGDSDGGERRERAPRDDRSSRDERGDVEVSERRERFARDDRGERRERGRGRFNGGDDQPAAPEVEDEGRLTLDFLPPAIGVVEDSAASEVDAVEEAPKPRRRTRRVKPAEDEGEIAPAA